ncbi:hypothetical protein Tco_0766597 [Tanacetum coccineum]
MVNTFVDIDTELMEGSEKKAGEELMQESAKKQKVHDDTEEAKLKDCMEIVSDEEEVAIDAIPLATKPPSIIDWKIYKERQTSYYQITRADGSFKIRCSVEESTRKDKFAAKEGESLESVYEILTTLVNIMDRNNILPIPMSINTKFLDCLQPEWSKYVTMVRHNQIVGI